MSKVKKYLGLGLGGLAGVFLAKKILGMIFK